MMHFNQAEFTTYAEGCISNAARHGIVILGFVSLLLLSTSAVLYSVLGFGSAYAHTFTMLAILALHITISSRGIETTPMLYMLGMTLLIIVGLAFVLLAHKTDAFA